MFYAALKKFEALPEAAKVVGDITAGVTWLAALAEYAPAAAALVSMLYGLLRIYEWIEKRINKKDDNGL